MDKTSYLRKYTFVYSLDIFHNTKESNDFILKTSRVYISRHMVFDEKTFPYHTTNNILLQGSLIIINFLDHYDIPSVTKSNERSYAQPSTTPDSTCCEQMKTFHKAEIDDQSMHKFENNDQEKLDSLELHFGNSIDDQVEGSNTQPFNQTKNNLEPMQLINAPSISACSPSKLFIHDSVGIQDNLFADLQIPKNGE